MPKNKNLGVLKFKKKTFVGAQAKPKHQNNTSSAATACIRKEQHF